jgi:predicted GIY-YIG superfamily endonuclease
MTARLWRQLGPAMPVYTVYALFDHDDRLLYVGVTGQREQRTHQHSATSTAWWYLVAHAAFEHFHGPTAKDDALARERELIQEFAHTSTWLGTRGPAVKASGSSAVRADG